MKTIVIKMGGELMHSQTMLSALCQAIVELKKAGNHIVIIHGGGPQISEMEKKLGKNPVIHHGRRVTDAESLDIIKMLLAGKLNCELVSTLQSFGVNAVGLTGIDGNLLKTKRRSPQKELNLIDFGYVGDIMSVDPALIQLVIEKEMIPVIAPLGADADGQIYNINADTVASAIALSLHADQWIILSNIDGVYDQMGKTIPFLTCDMAQDLINNGIIKDGMIPKISAIIKAVQAGLNEVHIVNGFKPEKLNYILSGESPGTMITGEANS